MYDPNYLDRQGLAMLASERREDQTESLSFRANERGGQLRFARRIMKSSRELIRPIALSVAAILLTSIVVAEAYSHAKVLNIRDPEDLALAYLLPTIFIAVFFGSTLAVAASFGSGLAAAYFIYPPQVSIWIEDPNHVAELGFILLLAITASKAVGVIIDGKPMGVPRRRPSGVTRTSRNRRDWRHRRARPDSICVRD
jgi:K+-sensing histidine kinase KdpD